MRESEVQPRNEFGVSPGGAHTKFERTSIAAAGFCDQNGRCRLGFGRCSDVRLRVWPCNHFLVSRPAKFGPTRVPTSFELGRYFGQVRALFGRPWPIFADVGSRFGRNRPESGRNCPSPVHIRPSSVQHRSNSALNWSISVHSGPNSAKLASMQVRPTPPALALFIPRGPHAGGGDLPNSVRCVDSTRPDYGRPRPDLAQSRPGFGHVCAMSARIRLELGGPHCATALAA